MPFETPICVTTQQYINYLLEDGYVVDDDRPPSPENKQNSTGDTERPVYKQIWKCNDIDHRRSAGCRRDAVKLYGMNEKFISVLTYLT